MITNKFFLVIALLMTVTFAEAQGTTYTGRPRKDDPRQLETVVLEKGQKADTLFFSSQTSCYNILGVEAITIHPAYEANASVFLQNPIKEVAMPANYPSTAHGFIVDLAPNVPAPAYFAVRVEFTRTEGEDTCYVKYLDIPILVVANKQTLIDNKQLNTKTFAYDEKLSACNPIGGNSVVAEVVPETSACDIFPNYVFDIKKGKHILSANESGDCFSKIIWSYNVKDDEKGSTVEIEFPKSQRYGVTVSAKLKDKKQDEPISKKIVLENREGFQFSYNAVEGFVKITAKELIFTPTSVGICDNEGRELTSMPINVTSKGFSVEIPVKGIDLKDAWVTVNDNGIKMAKPLSKGK